MRSAHVTHGMHAMRPAEPGSEARPVTDTVCIAHSRSVASANIRGTLSMDRFGGLAVTHGGVLRMHRRVARAVSIAHERPEFEPVVVRNFTPALAALMQGDNIVKTLARGVGQQMRLLQAAPAKTSRCSFRLQCRDRNSGCRRNSVQVGCARRNAPEYQNECRYNYS